MPLLTPVRRGLLYFCLHVVTLVAILALSKTLMQRYNFGEVLFLRLLPAWMGVVAFIAINPQIKPFKSKKMKGHFIRGFVGFFNMLLLYLSIKLLPLALAMTIRQLEAFIWVALAAFIYHEKVSRRQWWALAIGFLGVVLVLRPSIEANILGTVVAMGCAVTGAVVRVLSRELSKTENSTTIIFFNFSQWTLLSAFVQPWAWSMPDSTDWVALVLSGIVILVSQWLMTEGMALVPAARIAPFRHTEIFWAGLLGWLIWEEPISGWFIAGSLLIIAGGIAANWQVKKADTAPPLSGEI